MRRLLAAVAVAALAVATVPAAAAPDSYDMTCDLPGTSMPGACHWAALPDRIFRVSGSLAGTPAAATLTATWASPLVMPPAVGPHLRAGYTRLQSLTPGRFVAEARWRTATGRWSRWDSRVLPAPLEWSAKVPRGQQVMWEWRLRFTPAAPSATVMSFELRHAIG